MVVLILHAVPRSTAVGNNINKLSRHHRGLRLRMWVSAPLLTANVGDIGGACIYRDKQDDAMAAHTRSLALQWYLHDLQTIRDIRSRAGARQQATLTLNSVMPATCVAHTSYNVVQAVACYDTKDDCVRNQTAIATISAGSTLVADIETTDVQGRTHVRFYAAGEPVWACTQASDGVIALEKTIASVIRSHFKGEWPLAEILN